MVLYTNSIPFNLICNMTMFCKKLNFDPTPRVRGQGGGMQANFCYRVAAFVIPFNLICNMTMFWKSWILTPTQEPGLRSKIMFIMFHIYYTSVFMWKFWQPTELLRNLNIWPSTPPIPKGGGLWGSKILVTVMLIFRHWVIIDYSEKLSDIIVLLKYEVYSTKSKSKTTI